MADIDPYDKVRDSMTIEEPVNRGDSADSLFILRFIRTFIPIRSLITAVSPNSRNDEYVADLYEGGTEPTAFDTDHATKRDVLIYNINPNKTYNVGDQPTVLLMPDMTGIISPFTTDDVVEDVGEFTHQMKSAFDDVGVWQFAHATAQLP